MRWEDGFLPTAALLDAITPDMDVVMLCNPHNPIGALMSPDCCRAVADHCRETETWLLMDECFIDLTDDPARHTVKPLLGKYPRLFLLKAFTKLYAMPGLRLGYGLCADGGLLERMAACGQPWSVSVPAQAAGLQALQEQDYVQKTRVLVREERAFLTAGLRKMPLEVYEGAANFDRPAPPHREPGHPHPQLRQLPRVGGGLLPGGGAHTRGKRAAAGRAPGGGLLIPNGRRMSLWQNPL